MKKNFLIGIIVAGAIAVGIVGLLWYRINSVNATTYSYKSYSPSEIRGDRYSISMDTFYKSVSETFMEYGTTTTGVINLPHLDSTYNLVKYSNSKGTSTVDYLTLAYANAPNRATSTWSFDSSDSAGATLFVEWTASTTLASSGSPRFYWEFSPDGIYWFKEQATSTVANSHRWYAREQNLLSSTTRQALIVPDIAAKYTRLVFYIASSSDISKPSFEAFGAVRVEGGKKVQF